MSRDNVEEIVCSTMDFIGNFVITCTVLYLSWNFFAVRIISNLPELGGGEISIIAFFMTLLLSFLKSILDFLKMSRAQPYELHQKGVYDFAEKVTLTTSIDPSKNYVISFYEGEPHIEPLDNNMLHKLLQLNEKEEKKDGGKASIFFIFLSKK